MVAPTECTQEGQGGPGPQETQGRTRRDGTGRMPLAFPECTQDGQGSHGPQETQGRTGRVRVGVPPPPPLLSAAPGLANVGPTDGAKAAPLWTGTQSKRSQTQG